MEFLKGVSASQYVYFHNNGLDELSIDKVVLSVGASEYVLSLGLTVLGEELTAVRLLAGEELKIEIPFRNEFLNLSQKSTLKIIGGAVDKTIDIVFKLK